MKLVIISFAFVFYSLLLVEGSLFPDPANFLVNEPPELGASFRLSATLHDHMVLQRDGQGAMVWGFAPEGTTVVTSFGDHQITSKTENTTVWRARLPPTPATATPITISFTASTGDIATLSDVLFGDVYVCGGQARLSRIPAPFLPPLRVGAPSAHLLKCTLARTQSNMEFSIGGNENAAEYRVEANSYPNIRLFTVGQKTSSVTPLMDLATITQLVLHSRSLATFCFDFMDVRRNWAPANNITVSDGSDFNYFSAVCWFFGKHIYDDLGGRVPIGLISNNWGGTRVEQWTPPETTEPCGHASSGELYNAMIVPYTVGPMAVSGFTWYQGARKIPAHAIDCTLQLRRVCFLPLMRV